MEEKIGSYRIVRKLGEGGMGLVFEGVHDQIGRRVAIKVLHQEVSRNAELLARFYNEARAANLVAHPSIVDVHEIGQLPDGRAYIIMQFLDGDSLEDRLAHRTSRLQQGEVVRLVRQIASAMAAAHAKGIVHRDLKPSNVMIVADPETPGGERVKIVDFGIAKVLTQPENLAGPKPKTRFGMVLGTPAYMSPEQCRGAGEVTAKSDVYSLGVILFESLVGRTPFVAEGTGELIAKQLYEPPPALGDLDRSLPGPLVELVQRMLSKDASSRPTMVEVADLLNKIGAAASSEQPTLHESLPLARSGHTIDYAAPQMAKSAAGAKTNTGKFLAAGGVAVVVVAAGVFLLPRRSRGPADPAALAAQQTAAQAQGLRRDPKAAPPPVAPARVRWSIASVPEGAQIVLAKDQSVLGTTPWQRQVVAGDFKEELVLRLLGYEDLHLTLSGRENWAETIPLVERSQSAPGGPAGGEIKPAAHPRPKRDRPPSSHGPSDLTDQDIKVIQ